MGSLPSVLISKSGKSVVLLVMLLSEKFCGFAACASCSNSESIARRRKGAKGRRIFGGRQIDEEENHGLTDSTD
jgi:hypothetical protein